MNEDTPKIPDDAPRNLRDIHAAMKALALRHLENKSNVPGDYKAGYAQTERDYLTVINQNIGNDLPDDWDDGEISKWYVERNFGNEARVDIPLDHIPRDTLRFGWLCSAIASEYSKRDTNNGCALTAYVFRIMESGYIPNVPFEDLTAHLRELPPHEARLFCEELLHYSPDSTRELQSKCSVDIKRFTSDLIELHIWRCTGELWELDNYTKSDWARIPEFLEMCKRRELAELEPTVKPPQSNNSKGGVIPGNQEQRLVWEGTAVALARQEYPKFHGDNLTDVEIAERILHGFIVYRSGVNAYTKETFARKVTTARNEYLA